MDPGRIEAAVSVNSGIRRRRAVSHRHAGPTERQRCGTVTPRREVAVPPLSIIVPVYNGEKHLEECLRSIAAQTHGDFEAIIVDDGSTDGSLVIAAAVAARDDRFTVIPTSNGGVSRARNTGLRAARGTYVTFVDADDWLAPSMYEELLRATQERPYDAIAGDLVIESPRGGRQVEQARIGAGAYDAERIAREIWPILISSDRLTRDWPFRIVTKLFRRQHLVEHDLRFVPGLRVAQDFAFSVAAMAHATTFYYAKGCSGYHYRWNPASRTRTRLRSAWDDFRALDSALAAAAGDRDEFAVQLQLAELHGDLSAMTYLYRNARVRDSATLYREMRRGLGSADRSAAFRALNWQAMPPGKRVVCELMRRRRLGTAHCLLLARGVAQSMQERLVSRRTP